MNKGDYSFRASNGAMNVPPPGTGNYSPVPYPAVKAAAPSPGSDPVAPAPALIQGIRRASVKIVIPVVLGALSAASLPLTPLARADGRAEVSPGEFQRYRSQQELELEREQALRAGVKPAQSLEESKRQKRQFEAERFRQGLLLERQRRSVAIERAGRRPFPGTESRRGITLQQLQREQESERLSRKLTR